ncbi:hypothetical protein NT6N_26810 [Oceaniferula spumae]|uniref:Glycosyltransferase family 8 protein n=1 Tax=Oceaniferula spumae TaxID=2979115 RepID=A0AAT9FNS1_9BACT
MESDTILENRPFHIAFCANERFFPGLAVSLHSALLNITKGLGVKVYIVDAGLSDESKSSLCARYINRPEIEIEFLDWPRKLFKNVKVVNYHISSYLRLSLPELLDVKHLLYLDSDTIVFDDISKILAELKASPHPLAASPDWETKSPAQDSALIAKHAGVEHCDTYFNAGVLTLDLEALRDERFASRACKLLSELGDHASYADQSAFNALLAERWYELGKEWNTPSWAFDKQLENKLPSILHYTNSAPWLTRKYTPAQALFERIARDLDVDLPRPETSLPQSCVNAVILWLISPLRFFFHLWREASIWIKEGGDTDRRSLNIAVYWFEYFIYGPIKIVRYWIRIRMINNPSFSIFTG